MTTMLIANNCTRDNGQFMGDQLCYIKIAYLFVQNEPSVDKVLLSMSPSNEMHFLWQKFIDDPRGDGSVLPCEVVYDTFNPGDNPQRWEHWDKWRSERHIEGRKFDLYRELYLRIHGAHRQTLLCGSERGLGRLNIFEYVFYGQEHLPETCIGADWYDATLIYHKVAIPDRDVYLAPMCKTQGNVTFTFDYWADVVHRLIDAGVTVTVGHDGYFCEDLNGHPLYRKHWGDFKQFVDQVCRHKIVACGNTAPGWVAAACGILLFTMEPPNSNMPDHRYRQCGLRNIVEVMEQPDATYCAKRLIEEVNRVTVLTTGCYDVLHAGHIRHLQKARALGTRLVVALNSDTSVQSLKGTSRPINTQEQRKTVLEALRCVDEVQIFEGADALPVITAIKPQVLACGFGYTVDKIVGKEFVESYGGRVVVTCSGDAINEPSTTKIVARIIRTGDIIEVCRVAGAVSVNPFDKLRLMADQLMTVESVPGAMADVGAYRGGTSLILRRLAPDKELYLFDTWTGTPHDDDLCHHKKGEWKARLEDCKALVGNGQLTHYIEGVFPYSAEGLGDMRFSFVYVDPDTYQSVQAAINFFWPRMSQGGKLVFDDYGWHACAGVKKVVDEAFTSEQCIVYSQNYTCVVKK